MRPHQGAPDFTRPDARPPARNTPPSGRGAVLRLVVAWPPCAHEPSGCIRSTQSSGRAHIRAGDATTRRPLPSDCALPAHAPPLQPLEKSQSPHAKGFLKLALLLYLRGGAFRKFRSLARRARPGIFSENTAQDKLYGRRDRSPYSGAHTD